MPAPTASTVEQEGAKKVLVTDRQGRADVMSLEDAAALETVLRQIREAHDNDVGSKAQQAAEEKAQREGAEERLKQIKDANAKSDAEAAERNKKTIAAQEAGIPASQKRDIEERKGRDTSVEGRAAAAGDDVDEKRAARSHK